MSREGFVPPHSVSYVPLRDCAACGGAPRAYPATGPAPGIMVACEQPPYPRHRPADVEPDGVRAGDSGRRATTGRPCSPDTNAGVRGAADRHGHRADRQRLSGGRRPRRCPLYPRGAQPAGHPAQHRLHHLQERLDRHRAPPVSYTNRLKTQQMPRYGETGSPSRTRRTICCRSSWGVTRPTRPTCGPSRGTVRAERTSRTPRRLR